jgi:hypothetical protein
LNVAREPRATALMGRIEWLRRGVGRDRAAPRSFVQTRARLDEKIFVGHSKNRAKKALQGLQTRMKTRITDSDE